MCIITVSHSRTYMLLGSSCLMYTVHGTIFTIGPSSARASPDAELLTSRLVSASLVLVNGLFKEILATYKHAMLDARQSCPRLLGSPAPLPQPKEHIILVQHVIQLCQAVKATRLLQAAKPCSHTFASHAVQCSLQSHHLVYSLCSQNSMLSSIALHTVLPSNQSSMSPGCSNAAPHVSVSMVCAVACTGLGLPCQYSQHYRPYREGIFPVAEAMLRSCKKGGIAVDRCQATLKSAHLWEQHDMGLE